MSVFLLSSRRDVVFVFLRELGSVAMVFLTRGISGERVEAASDVRGEGTRSITSISGIV